LASAILALNPSEMSQYFTLENQILSSSAIVFHSVGSLKHFKRDFYESAGLCQENTEKQQRNVSKRFRHEEYLLPFTFYLLPFTFFQNNVKKGFLGYISLFRGGVLSKKIDN